MGLFSNQFKPQSAGYPTNDWSVSSNYKRQAKTEARNRNAALWQSSNLLGSMTGVGDEAAEAVNPTLDSYLGPGGMGEWKRGQINARTTDTNRSFNDALASNRLRARMSGFGYEQPAEQMGETNVENARADALGRIRGDVEAEAAPIQMNAAGLRLQSGGQQAGLYGQAATGQQRIASQFDPAQYYQLQEQANARKAALWGSLLNAGTSFATGMWGKK